MSGEVPGDLLRTLAPRVLGALTRRYGVFEQCEDAVQEALLAAAQQWPRTGVPDNPGGWLSTVAARRLTDLLRSDGARRAREDEYARHDLPEVSDRDDSLELLFLCCHPALTAPSQIALTLRSVGGLSTGQIARAFLVPEPTMAQRITRAKKQLTAEGATFGLADAVRRLPAVLHVLYLIFDEGYTATGGDALTNVELTEEAIRLTRTLHRLLPDDGEVTGLLALMLLTEARHPARVGRAGELIPLAEQDRSVWDRALVAEGVALISHALTSTALGRYQLQAAIAAVHDEAPSAEATDWPQILALYGLLETLDPSPMVTLNRAVALAMARGPQAGLALLESLDDRLADQHRLPAVRAHLLELAGRPAQAREEYLAAARRTRSGPEKRYLEARAARLASTSTSTSTSARRL